MINFSFDNEEYFDILKTQAIHMDQGVCYCPEYVATRSMSYYPSRVAQVIMAVYLGQMEATEYGANMIFSSILSGQGERWQNFGENSTNYLLTNILGRQLFVEKGFKKQEAENLKSTIKSNSGHILPIEKDLTDIWKDNIQTSPDSSTYLLIDDATFVYASKSSRKFGEFLHSNGIVPMRDIEPVFLGFEYLAAGLLDEGKAVLSKLIDDLTKKGVKRVITLSGQSNFMLTEICERFGICHDMEIIDVLDCANSLDVVRAYIYGGSFYTRILWKYQQFNHLILNRREEKVANSWEFVPLLSGDRRVNEVGLWTAPICPEYLPSWKNDEVFERIYQNGISELKRASFAQIVICDPYCYNTLMENGFEQLETEYFLNVLE